MIDPWSPPPPGIRGISYTHRRLIECIRDGVVSPSRISRRLGITPNHASVLKWQLKQRGIDVTKMKSIETGHTMQIRLTSEEQRAIEKQARQRCVSPQLLTQRMISVIIRDRLYDAIIDEVSDGY